MVSTAQQPVHQPKQTHLPALPHPDPPAALAGQRPPVQAVLESESFSGAGQAGVLCVLGAAYSYFYAGFFCHTESLLVL